MNKPMSQERLAEIKRLQDRFDALKVLSDSEIRARLLQDYAKAVPELISEVERLQYRLDADAMQAEYQNLCGAMERIQAQLVQKTAECERLRALE